MKCDGCIFVRIFVRLKLREKSRALFDLAR
jgi:hypothetical protein